MRAGGVLCERATSPALEGAEETEARSRATDECPETHTHPRPLARPRWSGSGGSLPGHNTRCILRPPPLLSCPPEGQEKVEEEVPGCGTSEEVPAWGKAPGAGETEPEGRDLLRSL